MESKQEVLENLNEQKTRPVFPKVFEGFKEIEELARAEDNILEILKNCVITAINDKNINTASEEKLAEWEEVTETEPEGTIEDRRAAVIEALGKNNAFNDKALRELVDKYAEGEPLEIETDCTNQNLTIIQDADDEEGTDPGSIRGGLPTRVARMIMEYVPQALKIFGETRTTTSKNIVVNHGTTTTIFLKTGGAE